MSNTQPDQEDSNDEESHEQPDQESSYGGDSSDAGEEPRQRKRRRVIDALDGVHDSLSRIYIVMNDLQVEQSRMNDILTRMTDLFERGFNEYKITPHNDQPDTPETSGNIICRTASYLTNKCMVDLGMRDKVQPGKFEDEPEDV